MTTTRWLWLAVLVAFIALEAWTLLDGVPGNTLSGEMQSLAAARPWVRGVTAAALGWLGYHWLIDHRRRR